MFHIPFGVFQGVLVIETRSNRCFSRLLVGDPGGQELAHRRAHDLATSEGPRDGALPPGAFALAGCAKHQGHGSTSSAAEGAGGSLFSYQGVSGAAFWGANAPKTL